MFSFERTGDSFSITRAPKLVVSTTIQFLKLTFLPLESVKWPSSNICKNKLKTSGCAFSTSSNKTIEYGFFLTASVS